MCVCVLVTVVIINKPLASAIDGLGSANIQQLRCGCLSLHPLTVLMVNREAPVSLLHWAATMCESESTL